LARKIHYPSGDVPGKAGEAGEVEVSTRSSSGEREAGQNAKNLAPELVADPPQYVEPPSADQQLRQRPGVKLGLALGGGAARGWAHIGALQALKEAGIRPDIIAGTSIGAVVGGCYAADRLDELTEFALQLTPARVLALLDVHVGSGLISGDRLGRRLTENLEGLLIEKLPLRFAAIATEFNTGHEIWLTRGSLINALRASYALPGIFDPRRIGGRWLMDGALVNPVPVTAARALGAEIVVAVNLSGAGYGRGTVIQDFGSDAEPGTEANGVAAEQERGLLSPVREAASRMRDLFRRRRGTPGFAQVMIDAFNITQDRITRARLAGDPPDVIASPQLSEIGLFEFHRAAAIIAAGRESVLRALPQVHEVMELAERSFLARQRTP
jgi:NTE family protein